MAGVVAAVITPVDASGSPDLERLIRRCAWLLGNGCDGINLLGTTGEAVSFAVEQRLAIMRAVATAGLPLERFMTGTGAAALSDTIVLTREAVRLGYRAALVIPPFYYKNLDGDGVFEYYARLIDRVAEPDACIYLYHFPALSGVAFDLELVARLVRAYPQTVRGIKDSSGSLEFARAVAAEFPAFDVFPSSETVLNGGRAAGFAGCVSATVNVSAPLAARVWAASADAKDAPATPDAEALAAIRTALARHPLVAAVKCAVARVFHDPDLARVLPPLRPLDAQSGADLVRDLEGIDAYRAIAAGAAERGA
jgi:4-hydroxy-tetrahydrodipicolinate synthase